jgi:hypothetical protein
MNIFVIDSCGYVLEQQSRARGGPTLYLARELASKYRIAEIYGQEGNKFYIYDRNEVGTIKPIWIEILKESEVPEYLRMRKLIGAI